MSKFAWPLPGEGVTAEELAMAEIRAALAGVNSYSSQARKDAMLAEIVAALYNGSGGLGALGAITGTSLAVTTRVASGRVVATYAPNIVIANNLGNLFVITPTDGNAFTVLAPGLAPIPANLDTQGLTILIRNTFGTLGAATFAGGAGGYRLGAAWTQPANGFSRAIILAADGTNWIEVSRTAVDVAN